MPQRPSMPRRPWRPPRRVTRPSRTSPPRAARPPRRRSCRRSGPPSARCGSAGRAPRSGPRATSSPRVMPPKMLTRMASTLGSPRMIRIAVATLSARAPPPMSRKLAGSPPARLTRSIVVIARPAPLTMQPMVPSSLMNVSPASRASLSAGASSSGSRRSSSPGCRASAESSSVTLASRQTSRSTVGAVRAGLAHDRERVDLDEVRVVGAHRRHEALGDRGPRPSGARRAPSRTRGRGPGSRGARGAGRRAGG